MTTQYVRSVEEILEWIGFYRMASMSCDVDIILPVALPVTLRGSNQKGSLAYDMSNSPYRANGKGSFAHSIASSSYRTDRQGSFARAVKSSPFTGTEMKTAFIVVRIERVQGSSNRMEPDDIVIRMLNEQGESVEAFRIHTDLIETEIDLASNGLTYTGTETTDVYFDDKLTDYTKQLGGDEFLPDALAVNASAEVAYKGGAQLEVSVIGILKGKNKGDFGVNLQLNGLLGIEAGVTGSVTGFYATEPNPKLDMFKGFEMGAQADMRVFGPASIAGAYHQGVEFQKPFDKNWNWQGFTKTIYEAISLGVSGGVVPLPVSFSGYLGMSDYLYRSDR